HDLFAVEVPVRWIFQHPTLQELAAAITRADRSWPGAAADAADPAPFSTLDEATRREIAARGEDVEDAFPLSPVPAGMLFEGLFAARSGVYVEQLRWGLRGGFDPRVLRQAAQETFDRHPLLRTAVVPAREERRALVVRRRVALPWQVVDLVR